MNYVLIIFVLFVLVAIYLNIVSTVALLKTDVLEKPQRIAQIIISWVIPIFGSLFVLHILVSTDTECLKPKWLIWPFRSIIFGKKNTNKFYFR